VPTVRHSHGNTPTDVGKTLDQQLINAGLGKHPHGRGEDHDDLELEYSRLETPPRTWGRRHLRVHLDDLARNTPTDVGKTSRNRQSLSRSRKHPHGRGEDQARATITTKTGETPPRTWGRLRISTAVRLDCRNTPTDVGKTKNPPTSPAATWKHPHGRGEDLPWYRVDRGGIRNTPTDVGKTVAILGHCGCREKHPHGRGEDRPTSVPISSVLETPPRTWGRRNNT
tara:strand:- start:9371 stop:10048 length:678 start_codon:yes stop_codon:yes gene_type:complete